MEKTKAGNKLEPSKAHNLKDSIDYSEDSIVSRIIEKGDAASITLFSFDAGQELSEHTAPFNAYVEVIDGQVLLIIGGKEVEASTGDIVLMPANIPHSVHAEQRFKMLLTMIKKPLK